MLNVQNDIKNENAKSAIQNILNCFDYIIEQYALEYGTRDDNFRNKKTKERLSVLITREQISPINKAFYNTVMHVRNNPDIPSIRSCYTNLLNLVDDFLDIFKYPTVKEFWTGLTPLEKALEGHDEAKMIEAMNNHPILIDLNDRLESHMESKNYEDAATNMRLIMEYISKQCAQEYAPDLYYEKLATQTEELLKRNIVDGPIKDAFDKIRKLGNALGAHLPKEKANVVDMRNCYFLLLNMQYDFLEVFHRPSDKEIPSKDNNNFINVEDIPVDHAYRNKSNKNNYSDDYFRRGNFVYRNGKTYRIFQGEELELKEGITLLRDGKLSYRPSHKAETDPEKIRKQREAKEEKERLEKKEHKAKIIRIIVIVIIVLIILEVLGFILPLLLMFLQL